VTTYQFFCAPNSVVCVLGYFALALFAAFLFACIVRIRCSEGVYGAAVFHWGLFAVKAHDEHAKRMKAFGYLLFNIRKPWYLGVSVPAFLGKRLRRKSSAPYIKWHF
jgi:hypothetical protein